jgi:ketosteroid isomerase-like protein
MEGSCPGTGLTDGKTREAPRARRYNPAVETLKQTFFEDPTVVYVLLAVAWLVIALFWRRSASTRMTIAMVVPFVLAGAVFLVSRGVWTDREKIVRDVNEIAGAVNEGDFARVRESLEEDFAVSGRSLRSAGAAIEFLRDQTQDNRFERVEIRNVDVDIEGRLAQVRVGSTVYFRGGARLSVRWDLTWARAQDRWKIRNLDSYAVGASPF